MSHHHKDHQLLVRKGLRSLLGQSGSLICRPKVGSSPEETREQPFGSRWYRGIPRLQHPIGRWQRSKSSLQRTGTIWLLFPSLCFPRDTWKGTVPLVEAPGQGPASPGRPLPRPTQPLLPFAPSPLPRSQRWAGGHWMTAAEPRPDSPSPPPRAGFPQSSPRRGAA